MLTCSRPFAWQLARCCGHAISACKRLRRDSGWRGDRDMIRVGRVRLASQVGFCRLGGVTRPYAMTRKIVGARHASPCLDIRRCGHGATHASPLRMVLQPIQHFAAPMFKNSSRPETPRWHRNKAPRRGSAGSSRPCESRAARRQRGNTQPHCPCAGAPRP
jgi:hypothetical protein